MAKHSVVRAATLCAGAAACSHWGAPQPIEVSPGHWALVEARPHPGENPNVAKERVLQLSSDHCAAAQQEARVEQIDGPTEYRGARVVYTCESHMAEAEADDF